MVNEVIEIEEYGPLPGIWATCKDGSSVEITADESLGPCFRLRPPQGSDLPAVVIIARPGPSGLRTLEHVGPAIVISITDLVKSLRHLSTLE